MSAAPAPDSKAHLPCAHTHICKVHTHIHFESAKLHFLAVSVRRTRCTGERQTRFVFMWCFRVFAFHVCIEPVRFPNSWKRCIVAGRAGLRMQMCLVCAIYIYIYYFPKTTRSTFLMQIDFEMTFIVQGFHMEVHSSRRACKKLNEMSRTQWQLNLCAGIGRRKGTHCR